MLSQDLRQSTLDYKSRPALLVANITYSYGQMLAEAMGFEKALNECEQPSVTQQPIAIMGNKGVTSYFGCFFALLAGRAYVPLNPKFPVARNLYALETANCGAIILDAKYAIKYREVLESLPQETVLICRRAEQGLLESLNLDLKCKPLYTDPIEDQAPHFARLEQLQAADTAYIMFTSGTTGVPKGVSISYGNVSHYVSSILDCYGIDSQARHSQTFDLTFDLSVHDMFVTWAAGACLVSFSESAMLAPVKLCNKAKVTHWFSVPTVAAMCNTLGLLRDGALPEIKLTLFCGEALPSSVAQAWSVAAPNAIIENIYGPTEATIAFTRYRFEADTDNPPLVPIGIGFGDNITRVVDTDSQELVDSEEGELLLGGPQLSSGYLNNPEKNALAFIIDPADQKRWYRTGDRVALQADGRIDYIGRLDSQIKFKGYRIELSEIEEALRKAYKTDVAAAFPLVSDKGVIEKLGGAVVTQERGSKPYQLSDAQERLAEYLPSYMIPEQVFSYGELPVNSNGKIDRNALAQSIS